MQIVPEFYVQLQHCGHDHLYFRGPMAGKLLLVLSGYFVIHQLFHVRKERKEEKRHENLGEECMTRCCSMLCSPFIDSHPSSMPDEHRQSGRTSSA